MYLARLQSHNRMTYILRQSYATDACMKTRDLFDLGPDPSKFIVYPGGNSYYYDPDMVASLEERGVPTVDDALDRILFPFLRPRIQKIITDFDRERRHGSHHTSAHLDDFVHDFDKRRYHYLRFGHSTQKYLHKVPQRTFRPLMEKSRDELEQYFRFEEEKLLFREKPNYLLVIFQLHRLQPSQDSLEPLLDQMDALFIDTICRLNDDKKFLAGTGHLKGLYPYLAQYAMDYFDQPFLTFEDPYAAFWDFVRRHRKYTPPPKVQLKIKEAETLFGFKWQVLKKMSRSELSRVYRKAAIKHHPDQGGDADAFRRLSQVYQALKSRKGRG